MDKFENKLIIKVEKYENGLFPKIPHFKKYGSAFLLTGGVRDDIVVDEHTTTKEIRNGKYTELVEISTFPQKKVIQFESPSKEQVYLFDVCVTAVIEVVNPILFYQNRNLDVDAYFKNLFALDVKRITTGYSILNYEKLDENLTKKLASYNTVDETIGFSYQISSVGATPGKDAQPYIKRYSQLQLEAELKLRARKAAESYHTGYVDALWTAVAEGRMSDIEAATKQEEYEKGLYEDNIKKLVGLKEKGFITDTQMKKLIAPALKEAKFDSLIEGKPENINRGNIALDDFYTEDEE